MCLEIYLDWTRLESRYLPLLCFSVFSVSIKGRIFEVHVGLLSTVVERLKENVLKRLERNDKRMVRCSYQNLDHTQKIKEFFLNVLSIKVTKC